MTKADEQNGVEAAFRIAFDHSNVYRFGGSSAGAALAGMECPSQVRASLQSALRRGGNRPFLVPFKGASGDLTCWYACAHDGPSVRALRSELEAFIGPSFAYFEDGAVAFPIADPILAALEDNGIAVFRFRAAELRFEERILTRWESYWNLLQHRPVRAERVHQTLAQLRAMLDTALLARNEAVAQAAIAAMRDQHALSAENRAFLQIRIAAAFGRWADILDHRQWAHVVHLRLPPETYGDLWDALYETYLRPIEVTGDASRLLEVYARDVRALAGPLLRGRGKSKRPAALKGLLLDALTRPQPSEALCRELLSAVGPESFGASSAGLIALLANLEPAGGAREAFREMDSERYEQAFALLWPLADSAEVLAAMLRCAKEVADPLLALKIFDRIKGATAAIRQEVLARRARLLGDIEKLAAAAPLVTSEQPTLVPEESVDSEIDVVAHWREIARAELPDRLLNDSDLRDQLRSTMEEHALSEHPAFESLFPIWFEWVVVRSPADARLIPTYQAFIDTLRVRDRFGGSELELVRQAAHRVLFSGPDPNSYRRLVDGLVKIFEGIRAPTAVDWALEISDDLAVASCRDPGVLAQWRSEVFSAAIEFRHRLSAVQIQLLRLLASESNYSLPDGLAVSASSASADIEDPGVRVLLYSLDPEALKRASTVLTTLLPESRFDLNSETDCSTRLKSATRNADWIVFVSAVATHAAYYCIKGALKAESELIQIKGTGTTRIIQAVVERCRAGVAA